MCRKFLLLVLVLTLFSIASVASASTVAYWRFEPGESGIDFSENAYPAVPDSNARSVWRKAAHDWSGNGNHLTTWEYSWAGHDFSTDVPSATVPQTGASNAQSIVSVGGYPAAYTWSAQSNPSGVDIETITPAQFTVEAAFKMTESSGFRTIVGRDGQNVWTEDVWDPWNWAPFYLSVRPENQVAVEFVDLDGYQHTAESAHAIVTTDKWYCIAGISDGEKLSLYLKDVALGGAYQLVAEVALDPNSTDTRLAIGEGGSPELPDEWIAGGWTVARGLWGGGHVDRLYGNIDEVRISDVALNPSELLCVPEPATIALLGLGSLALLRRRKR